jgi:hypothetical protein
MSLPFGIQTAPRLMSMSAPQQAPLQPVGGDVIPYARGALVRSLLQWGAWVLASAGLMCWSWFLPDPGWGRPAHWLVAIVLTLVSGCSLLIGVMVLSGRWSALRLRERLVLGTDRLQLHVQDSVVVGDIPYDAIADIGGCRGFAGLRQVDGRWVARERDRPFGVGIRLSDPDRADVVWPALAELRRLWQPKGFDLVLVGPFEETVESVLDRLLGKYREFRREPGAQGQASRSDD